MTSVTHDKYLTKLTGLMESKPLVIYIVRFLLSFVILLFISSTAWLGGTTRQSRNITYFSFTCTPTRKCLEMFGTPHAKTIKQPFYTYSMRDAIRDGLVLDVTQNYSTVVVLAKMTQAEIPSTPTTPENATTTSPTPVTTTCSDASSPNQLDVLDASSNNPTLVVHDAGAAIDSLDVELSSALVSERISEQEQGVASVLLEDTSSTGDQSVASSCETSPASSAEGINSSQSSTPQSTVYLEARKAAYHVLRIPGADTVKFSDF